MLKHKIVEASIHSFTAPAERYISDSHCFRFWRLKRQRSLLPGCSSGYVSMCDDQSGQGSRLCNWVAYVFPLVPSNWRTMKNHNLKDNGWNGSAQRHQMAMTHIWAASSSQWSDVDHPTLPPALSTTGLAHRGTSEHTTHSRKPWPYPSFVD